ncbi:hypothetical protein FCT18_09075 [Lysinibacillus sphaericus]|uniref:Uncharacterized protein n=3 Tax=Lysinibacillus TaxID=400634 RepID=A0A2S0JZL5_LYSSH|nr:MULTISPECIES: hypothetical protein [Lysinibacillus]AHN24304.1 hypothetical protein T479_13330 [Lysinibacillus varians]AVK96575.1 hypothetical protein LS41612_10015 [Lysinibacillus sphaericus]MCS1383707.1 hypothetical protein [Lysinibacillus sphaericus]MED4542894.1 hypothetical protein [Lysinibacillus sphaericus]TKI19818.1 hypothetical protein FCT18_09075 [Lysinibacillus sphaericus]
MLGKSGKLSALFSVAGLIVIACFYYFQIEAVIVILVGGILIAVGIIFSILSFIKKEKGFWKYTPYIVLWLYFLGIFLSIILLFLIGER